MPEQTSQSAGGGGPRLNGPGGGRGGEKPKDFSGALRQLAAYSRKYLPAILIAVVLAALGSILNIIGPQVLKEITNLIVDGLSTQINIPAIAHLAVILAILYGLGFVSNAVQGVVMATSTQGIAMGMRSDLSRKVNRLPLRYFDRTSYGDVLSRMTNDVDTVGQSLNQSLGTLVSAGTMLVGTLIMMFWTNPIMAASGVAASLVGFALMILIVARSQKYFARQQSALGRLNGHIEEIYSGHTIVKAYNGEKAARWDFDKMNQELYDSAWRSQFFSGLNMPIMSFVGNFSYVVVCVVGAALTLNGTIKFGTVVAFILYIRLFTQPLSQLAQAVTGLQSAAAACERVFQFLDEEEMEPEADVLSHLDHAQGQVDFDHVRFGYDPEHVVIQDFSTHIKPGQKVAIVGPTGAGKTTLVNLLLRFYELDGGEIRLDGVPISSISRENLRRLFGMVLQDTWLFQGTVRENIAYNNPDVTDDQVEEACKLVGLHHYIRTLPHGYQTILDDNSSLSAGQRQLVTIARAMVENAPVLILDEATSSVDTRTEALIQQAMDRLTQGRTSFVIAHRLSTIRNADVILVLRDGDIAESGTHEELLAKGGFYTQLYNSQFQAVS